MSRKDFVQIAAQIQAQLDGINSVTLTTDIERAVQCAARATVIDTAHRLCGVFADANPRFNRNIFLAACGIN